jgi:hypothetical protein
MVAVLAAACPAGAATVIFQDGFETYAASSSWPSSSDTDPGTSPVGDGWLPAEPTFDNVQVLSTTQNLSAGPHSGSNFLQVYGTNSSATMFITAADQTLVQQNKNATLDMWVYKNLADGWNGLEQIAGFDGSSTSFQLYLRQNGQLQYFDGALKETGLTFASDSWMHLTVAADFANHTFDLTLDGQPTVTGLRFANSAASKVSHVVMFGQADVDVNCRAAYDDITMTVNDVPEPGTLMLLTCGLSGLLAYAWRKRK